MKLLWLVLLALLSTQLVGCGSPGPWRMIQEPYTTELIGEREDARVTLNDGSVVVLEYARIVLNPWDSYVAGDGEGGRRRQISFDDVHRLEARKRAPERFSDFDDATQLLFVVGALLLGAVIWNNASF